MDIYKLLTYIGTDITTPIGGAFMEPIIINDKEYKAHLFKPGNQLGTANKGVTYSQDKTIAAKLCKAKDLKTLKAMIATHGVERVWDIMQLLDDKDFLDNFFRVAPYTLPKINAIDYKQSEGKVVDITELQSTHTITVRDMRNNSITHIPE